MAELKAAADPRFNSPVMPQSVRLFRSTVPGPDTGPVILVSSILIWPRTEREWRSKMPIRSGRHYSRRNRGLPETLLSVELLTSFGPTL